jgi:DNA-binding transcriptional LysR family regulator
MRRVSVASALASGRLNLQSMSWFLRVVEHGNFNHAAKVLGVAQSSVSYRVRTLEDALGMRLLERHTRGVRPTQAGRRLAAEFADIVARLDHAIHTVGAIAKGIEGSLHIGLHSSIASGFLPELRGRFRQAYPAIVQTVTEGRSADTVAMVRESKLDVTFVAGIAGEPDCHSRVFWSEPLIVALPEHHKLAGAETVLWNDLVSETFLARTGGSGPQAFDYVVRRVAERHKTPRIERCDVGRDTLMHMVAQGDGLTLTTEAIIGVPFPGVVFKAIADEPEPVMFSAVWSPHNHNPALRNFLDLAGEMSRSAGSV